MSPAGEQQAEHTGLRMGSVRSVSVVVVNRSQLADDDVAEGVSALQEQVRDDFTPVWNVGAKLRVHPGGSYEPRPDERVLVLLDDPLGPPHIDYPDLTPAGMPVLKVLVSRSSPGWDWTHAASHELLEMLVDPDLSAAALRHPDAETEVAELVALRVCDPCASYGDGYGKRGRQVSDFVFPVWFDSSSQTGGITRFDERALIDEPFKVRPGGYIQVYSPPHAAWMVLGSDGARDLAEPYEAELRLRDTARHSGGHELKLSLRLSDEVLNLQYPIAGFTEEDIAELVAQIGEPSGPVAAASPPPASPPPASAAQQFANRVDDALAATTRGRFAFNPPARMRQGEVARVTVGITRSTTLEDELRASLRGSGIAQFSDIETSPLMSVELLGEQSFAITPLSELEQPVSKIEVTGWEFDVRALHPGNHTLTVKVALRLPVPGHDDLRRSLSVLERSVEVRVAPVYVARQFVRGNWQWIIGTAVAVIGAAAAWVKLAH
jgi:hypothetical protein